MSALDQERTLAKSQRNICGIECEASLFCLSRIAVPQRVEFGEGMARKREMKNAVQGILGSFVSRNNDVDGYWGIGKLYRSAIAAGCNSVRIDLIGSKMLPRLDGFHGMIEKYENLLEKQFPDRRHYKTWLVSAEITIQFESDADQSSIPKWYDSGKPFTCVVSM